MDELSLDVTVEAVGSTVSVECLVTSVAVTGSDVEAEVVSEAVEASVAVVSGLLVVVIVDVGSVEDPADWALDKM